jgi:hypothetical protein
MIAQAFARASPGSDDQRSAGWEEPLAKEPEGVVIHGGRRPLLGRKLQGKSQRELRDPGLLVEDKTP